MSFSAPTAISLVGDARLVRNVFRPATALVPAVTYISYVAEIDGVMRLVLRSTAGVDFSEIIIPTIVRDIDSYSIVCREDDKLLVAWSDRVSCRLFTFDINNPTTTSAPVIIADGFNPELSTPVANKLQIFYTRASDVFRRISSDNGDTWTAEQALSNPTNTSFDRYGMGQKPNTTKVHYLTDLGYGPKASNGVALPMSVQGSTTLLLNGTNPVTENLTEGQPAGVTNYYTMNDANMSGGSILDVGGGGVTLGLDNGTNNSTTGQISQARSFDGSTRWRAGSTSDLAFAGDLTIRFWVKINNYNVNHHPIAKAYGGEYGFIIRTDGQLAVYWGSAGGLASPYQGLFTAPGTIVPGTWYHVTYTRDIASRVARLYLNGVIVMQDTIFVLPSTSGQFAYVGYSPWTNQHMQGAVDELVFNNVALTPLQVKLSYEKGIAGNADTVSASTSLLTYRDVSGTYKLHPQGTFQRPQARNQLGIQGLSTNAKMWGESAAFSGVVLPATFETWLKLGTNNSEKDAMFDNHAPLSDIVGSFSYREGLWSIGFQNNKRLRFTYFGALLGTGNVSVTNGSGAIVGSGTSFLTQFKNGDFVKFSSGNTIYQISSISDDTHLSLTGNYTDVTASGLMMSKIGKHNLIQTTPANVYRPDSFNYYGLSLDGSIDGVTLVLNGYRMKTFWLVEQFNIPVAAPGSWATSYTEGKGTVLDSVRISNVAKSLSTMRNYFRGLTL